jgi:hypothetical protein
MLETTNLSMENKYLKIVSYSNQKNDFVYTRDGYFFPTCRLGNFLPLPKANIVARGKINPSHIKLPKNDKTIDRE